jgi:hypothetical protein
MKLKICEKNEFFTFELPNKQRIYFSSNLMIMIAIFKALMKDLTKIKNYKKYLNFFIKLIERFLLNNYLKARKIFNKV